MRIARALWILTGLLVCFAASAAAEETPREIRHRSGADILAHEDGMRSDASWLSMQLDRLHVHKKRGLAYTRAVDRGERSLEWSVHGPAVGRKKAVGLGFELRF